MSHAGFIIDAHCHIYPDGISRRAVDAVDRFYDGLPGDHFDGTVHTLTAAGKEAGVSRFVVHSVATKPEQVGHINAFIAGSCEASGGAFFGLGTLHPSAPDLEKDLEELLSLGLHGVKLHPDIQRFEADCESAMQIYAMCEEKGLPVLVHTGDYRYDYSNPARIARILEAFPRLNFIGAHFGGWSVWENAAELLSKYPNIAVDSSSSMYWLGPEKTRRILESWGIDRVMYGTDYPLWPMKDEIGYLEDMHLTDDEYERIFFRNAQRIYGIPDPRE